MNYTLKTLFKLLLLVPYSVQSAAVSSTFFTPGFGTNGYVQITTDYIGDGYASVKKCVVDSSGKIIVFGQSQNNKGLIVRYNSDGSIDTVFTQVGTNSECYFDGLIDTDGSIIAVGATNDQNNATAIPLLVRYNSNGTINRVFEFPTISNTSDGQFTGVALDSQRNIIVVGGINNTTASSNHRLIVKYYSGGGLFTSFNSTGYKEINPGDTNYSFFHGVAIDSQDRIIAVGTKNTGTSSDGVIERYTSTGDADTSFNNTTGGLQGGTSANSDIYRKVFIDSSGKLITVGASKQIQGYSYALTVRYNTTGSLDISFNTYGYITANTIMENAPNSSYDMCISNDKIFIVAERSGYYCILISYNSDGSLNTNLNKTGYLLLQPSSIFYQIYSIAIDQQNRLIVGGSINTSYYGLISRFLQTGTIDSISSWSIKNAKEYFKQNNIKTGII